MAWKKIIPYNGINALDLSSNASVDTNSKYLQILSGAISIEDSGSLYWLIRGFFDQNSICSLQSSSNTYKFSFEDYLGSTIKYYKGNTTVASASSGLYGQEAIIYIAKTASNIKCYMNGDLKINVDGTYDTCSSVNITSSSNNVRPFRATSMIISSDPIPQTAYVTIGSSTVTGDAVAGSNNSYTLAKDKSATITVPASSDMKIIASAPIIKDAVGSDTVTKLEIKTDEYTDTVELTSLGKTFGYKAGTNITITAKGDDA